MFGPTSLANENAARPLKVEADQAASSWHATSGQGARLLWTGLGFGVIMLFGVSACALVPLASQASANSAHRVQEVAGFALGVPALQPSIDHADPIALRPAVKPGVSAGTLKRPIPSIYMSEIDDKTISRRNALLAATAPFGLAYLATLRNVTMMSEEMLIKKASKLTPLQQDIALKGATEVAFTGKTTNGFSHDNKQEGMYLGAISGAPIFDSNFKFDSGTGWPSFYYAVPRAVIERPDPRDLLKNSQALAKKGGKGGVVRTEVIDARSGAHLGHVFNDGPRPTGKRYCINAGAMTFDPKKQQEEDTSIIDVASYFPM